MLGFLSSGKVNAKKPLGEYIDKILKMTERPFSQKVTSVTYISSVADLDAFSFQLTMPMELGSSKQLYNLTAPMKWN